jgi:O-antigen ligase
LKFLVFAIFAPCLVALGYQLFFRLEKWRSGALAALVGTLPFQPDITFFFRNEYANLTPLEMGFSVRPDDLLIAGCGAALLAKRELARPPHLVLLLVFILSCLVSTCVSAYPLLGFFAVWRYLMGGLLFVVLWNWFRLDRDPTPILRGLLLSAGVLIASFAVELAYTQDIHHRFEGLLSHPNRAGILACVLLVLGPAGTWYKQRKVTPCSLIFLCGLFATIFLTQSRLAYLLAMSVFPVLVLVSRTLGRRAVVTPLILSLLAAACFLTLPLVQRGRVFDAENLLSSGLARVQLNKTALKIIKGFPLGVGPNSFRPNFFIVESELDVHEYGTFRKQEGYLPHNILLLVGSEQGLPGLLLAAAISVLMLAPSVGRVWSREFLCNLSYKSDLLTLVGMSLVIFYAGSLLEYYFRDAGLMRVVVMLWAWSFTLAEDVEEQKTS